MDTQSNKITLVEHPESLSAFQSLSKIAGEEISKRDSEILKLKEQVKILREWLEESTTTICVLCKIVNPQHSECTSCDDMETCREVLNNTKGEDKI
jgi:hypothetical protein